MITLAQPRKRYRPNNHSNKWLIDKARIRALQQTVRMIIDHIQESFLTTMKSWQINKICKIKCEPSIIQDQVNMKFQLVSMESKRLWPRSNIYKTKDWKALEFKSSKIVVTFSPNNRDFKIEIKEKEASNQVQALTKMSPRRINYQEL